MSSPEVFKQRVLEAERVLVDPKRGVHHSFPDGRHGKMLNLDERRFIKRPDILEGQIGLMAERIYDNYTQEGAGHIALIGIAGRTNRTVGPVAEMINGLGHRVHAFNTQKTPDGGLELTDESESRAMYYRPELAIVVGGVAINGRREAEAALLAQRVGAKDIEALVTWQRSSTLSELDDMGINYDHLVQHEMRVQARQKCIALGRCAAGDQLIPHYIEDRIAA